MANSRGNPLKRPLLHPVPLFLGGFGFSLLLYAGTLNSFFVFDDLSILRIVHVEERSWLDCFRPMTNGFMRPGALLLALSLDRLFGLSPFAFHVASICLHALVAVLTARAAFLVYDSRAGGVLAATLFAIHIGAWAGVAMFQNACDVLLAIGLLGALLAWNAYLARPSVARNVHLLVDEMQRLSPQWKPGDMIVILDHPHPGTEPDRWIYCQHLVAVFLGRTDITVALGETPKAAYTYRFVDGKLLPKSLRTI